MPLVPFDYSETQPCPGRPGWVRVDGRQVPKRCGASRCEYCGPLKALQTAHVIAEGLLGTKPTRRWAAGFRNVPEEWQERRRLANTLAEKARKMCAPAEFEWAITYHRNSDRDHPGYHLHAAARAERDAIEYLMREVEQFDSEPYYEPVDDPSAWSRYLVHHALEGEHERFLDWNRGRYVHATEGFIDGGWKPALARERARAFQCRSSSPCPPPDPPDFDHLNALLDGVA